MPNQSNPVDQHVIYSFGPITLQPYYTVSVSQFDSSNNYTDFYVSNDVSIAYIMYNGAELTHYNYSVCLDTISPDIEVISRVPMGNN